MHNGASLPHPHILEDNLPLLFEEFCDIFSKLKKKKLRGRRERHEGEEVQASVMVPFYKMFEGHFRPKNAEMLNGQIVRGIFELLKILTVKMLTWTSRGDRLRKKKRWGVK